MSEVRREEEMLAEAKKKGLVVVYPKPNQLFIDIDDGLDVWRRNYKMFAELHAVKGWRMAPSPSGSEGHFHITVDLEEPISDEIRIYWQALLGSDLTREMLALRHLKAGHPPTVFFEKPSNDTVFGEAVIVEAP